MSKFTEKQLVPVSETVDILWTLIEACHEMLRLFQEEQCAQAVGIAIDMRTLLEQMQGDVDENGNDKVESTLWKMYGNCLYSLGRILKHAITDVDFSVKRTEFEMLPLLRATLIYARYNMDIKKIGKEAVQKWIEGEAYELTKNHYYEEGKSKRKWKYDLSISVTGFNKLEYTKKCVDSIIKNLPKDISYELILYNHGSSDGTKEFFESIYPDKQIDILYNGYAGLTPTFVSEGEILLGISNDVIITPNSIDIMYKTIKSDSKIGFLVPMTGGVSNLQTPKANGLKFEYQTDAELSNVAEAYNSDDSKLAETRFRLVNPLSIIRREVLHRHLLYGIIWNATVAFPDDRVSMLCRRMGYKNVFLKNVYCHHYGSVTLGKTNINYDDGRRVFLDEYGMDPWGRGFCWNPALFSILNCGKIGTKKVMGIDCGMGSDPLKIQQNVKMYTKEPEAELICLSRKNRYINELIGVCDKVYKYKMWSEVFSIFESDNSFDYIIIEDHIMGYKKMISRVYDELLAPNGFLVLFALEKDKPTHEWIKKEFKNNLKYSQKTNLSSDFDEYNRPERIGRFIVIEKGMDAC